MEAMDQTAVGRDGTRQRILDIAIEQFRLHGYAKTSLADVCQLAQLTKGALFHYFPTKKALGEAAAKDWARSTSEFFASSPYHEEDTSQGRILAYSNFRKMLISEDPLSYSCLAGTLAQEVFQTEPSISQACGESIFGLAETFEDDITTALAQAGWPNLETAGALARFTQVTIQGGFVLAKAAGSPKPAIEALDCLILAFSSLFSRQNDPGAAK